MTILSIKNPTYEIGNNIAFLYCGQFDLTYLYI